MSCYGATWSNTASGHGGVGHAAQRRSGKRRTRYVMPRSASASGINPPTQPRRHLHPCGYQCGRRDRCPARHARPAHDDQRPDQRRRRPVDIVAPWEATKPEPLPPRKRRADLLKRLHARAYSDKLSAHQHGAADPGRLVRLPSLLHLRQRIHPRRTYKTAGDRHGKTKGQQQEEDEIGSALHASYCTRSATRRALQA